MWEYIKSIQSVLGQKMNQTNIVGFIYDKNQIAQQEKKRYGDIYNKSL